MVELRRNQGPAICEFCLEKKNIPPGGLRHPGSGDTIGLQESLSHFQVLKQEFAVLREEARRIFLHRRTVPHIANATNRVFPFARKGEGLGFPRGKPRVLPRHCRIQLFRRFALCRWCSTSARRRRTSGVLGKRPSPTSSRRVRRMRHFRNDKGQHRESAGPCFDRDFGTKCLEASRSPAHKAGPAFIR